MSDLVLALGKKDSLVATVKRYSGLPHDAVDLGSFLHPNLEKIFVLGPDWVLTDDTVPPPSGRSRWESLGTRTVVLTLKSVTDLGAAADRLLAEIFGESRRLSPALARCLARVRTSAQSTALIFVSVNPPILAGRASFLSSLADTAGHRNLAGSDWAAAYPSVTEEWLLTHRPDRLFYLDQGFEDPGLVLKRAEHWWPSAVPPIHSLPQDKFAKASFEVLTQWEQWRRHTPKECHEVL